MASRFGMSALQKLTRGLRVARAAAKRAAAAGVPIRAKSLRVWLSRADTAHQLRQCTESSLEQAAQRLVYVVPGRDAEQRRLDALRVLRIVMEEYVRSVSPQEAALFTSEWERQSAVEDGGRTRETVLAARDDVLGRLDARSGFDAALRTLSPWSSQEALRLRAAWPAVETAVGLLTEAETERGAVLQGWAVEYPAWLQQAPAQAFAWLGQVASDYGAPGASRIFFEGCLREGGHPRDFLVARAALQTGSEAEQEVRQFLDAHQDMTSPLLDALRNYLDEDWAGCLRHLGRWEPHNALAGSLRVRLEAEALTRAGQESEALTLLRAANRDAMFTGTAVHLAVALLQHAVHGRTPTRLADAQEALAVSVRARNSRRAWYGDSTEAAVLAVQAAVLCGDLSMAWSLTQPPPEGEALPREAADQRLREQTALVAALSGREQEAEQLLKEIAGPVGVRNSQRDRLGDALLVAEPGTELLDETEDGAVVLVRVELVAVEPARSTDRFGRGGGNDGPVVEGVGTFVDLAGGGAEDPLQGGRRGVGDVADGGDPVPGQGPCHGGADTVECCGRLRAEERRDLVGALADDRGGAVRGDGGCHGRDHAVGTGAC